MGRKMQCMQIVYVCARFVFAGACEWHDLFHRMLMIFMSLWFLHVHVRLFRYYSCFKYHIFISSVYVFFAFKFSKFSLKWTVFPGFSFFTRRYFEFSISILYLHCFLSGSFLLSFCRCRKKQKHSKTRKNLCWLCIFRFLGILHSSFS